MADDLNIPLPEEKADEATPAVCQEHADELAGEIQLGGEYAAMRRTVAWKDLEKFIDDTYEATMTDLKGKVDVSEIHHAQGVIGMIDEIRGYINSKLAMAEGARSHRTEG